MEECGNSRRKSECCAFCVNDFLANLNFHSGPISEDIENNIKVKTKGFFDWLESFLVANSITHPPALTLLYQLFACLISQSSLYSEYYEVDEIIKEAANALQSRLEEDTHIQQKYDAILSENCFCCQSCS